MRGGGPRARTSLPFQFNYDDNLCSTEKGERSVLNIQTVIPFHLNEQWNIIPCTILPLVKLENVPPNDHEDDVGDVLQCLFFSPSVLVNHL